MTDTFEITIDTMAHGGSGLGRHSGRVVFVPYTIPGERAEVRPVSEKGRVVFGQGVRLVEASADRVLPRCPHFGPGRCGRCQWQHIAYPAQLLLKQDVLADQLERIGGFRDAEVRPLIPCSLEWGYNARMTFNVVDGELALPAAGQDMTLHPISECHILNPDLLALKDSLDLETITGLRELTLLRGSDGATMLVIRTHDDEPPELETDVPMSVNLLSSDNEPVNLIGDLHARYTVKGRDLRVTAGSYFRANLTQLERLVDVVLETLGSTEGQAVLDLYAGVGLFSVFLSPRARRVTLVESHPQTVSDAEENLSAFSNVDIIEGSVEDVLGELDDQYAVALLDPPDDGLSVEVIDALVALRLPRLVYLSGDPATLARDGKRLAAQGYTLRYVQPIDLAPQTYYIDAVALFERG
ncbi:MAG: class I SAM-dependent RNA methyltransferase [Anaerolineae bacterium]|nr:class I SAM-dependent RNA methyltransferase [Anaerolineae bacterium]